MAGVDGALEPRSLEEKVAEIPWYHTLELAPGVVTPGFFDTRSAARLVPMPASLAGRRCLDLGTYDGFWAFEMERRGAVEVVAADVLDPRRWDWPVASPPEAVAEIESRKRGNRGFELAKDALASSVSLVDRSIYELDERDTGRFDFVYLGSMLLHLRDPVGALERVRGICDGEVLVEEAVDLPLTLGMPRAPAARLDGRGRPWWWKPNVAALVRMVESAGFRVVEGPRRFYMPFGPGQARPRLSPRQLLTPAGREQALLAWRGDPHAAVLARPA